VVPQLWRVEPMSAGVREADGWQHDNDGLEQYCAMSHGSHGQYGNHGIVFSVSYRFHKTIKGSNPTLPASLVFYIVR
jgi:hypothetical protein